MGNRVNKQRGLRSPSGFALILVIFIVALASIIVLNLTYSNYLGSRLDASAVRQLQAEYLLKSAVQVARALLREDKSVEDTAQDKTWGPFVEGREIPPELIGLNLPNIRLSLEIRPEESKIPLRAIVPVNSGAPDKKWRAILTRLFQELGFDDDKEVDQTGYFPERHLTSEELVAALIDYVDADKDSYEDPDRRFARGIESDLPQDYFPNEQIRRIGELAAIPGFTPARIRKLSPFVTVFGSSQKININLAPKLVLRCLHPDLSNYVDAIVDFRNSKEGPFTPQNRKLELSRIVGDDIFTEIDTMVDVSGRWFQVLAKVDYGTSVFFMRSMILKREQDMLPDIKSVELF